jgi:ABC-2 type transport system permease protein
MIRWLDTMLRVVWACLKKDVRSVWTEKAFLFQTIVLPLNYNMLLILFALSGSNAPTAVVMTDQGPYAQQFYSALASAHSFHLQNATEDQAQALMQSGEIVAIVTIPADFDARLQSDQAVQVGLQVNNLNTDFTDDVRRGVRLAITSFSAQAFPGQVTIFPQESDAYPQDIDYIPYLSVSILVIGSMVAGLLQAGTSRAREWEKGTIKELLLAPVPRLAIVLGQMLASALLTLGSSVLVLLFVTLIIGDWPMNWGLVLLTLLLTTLIFVALGTVLGNWLRRRQTVTLTVRGVPIPLFWLSGVFAPITFSTTAVIILARIFPTHYAITLQQMAFFGFQTNPYSVSGNVLIECAFLFGALVLATLTFRRGATPR